MSDTEIDIPETHTAMIRRLTAEGLPVDEIAYLMRVSERIVREVQAAEVITTKESPTEGGAADADDTDRAGR